MDTKKRNMILVGIISVLMIACLMVFLLMPAPTDVIRIKQNEKLYGTYSLNKNQTIKISKDKEYNIIEIKDHTVYMSESTCPHQICVNTPALSKEHPGMIVCLPHGIIIELAN